MGQPTSPLPPTSSLPPLRQPSNLTEAQISAALDNLCRIYCVNAILSSELVHAAAAASSAVKADRLLELKQTDSGYSSGVNSGYASETEDEVEQEVDLSELREVCFVHPHDGCHNHRSAAILDLDTTSAHIRSGQLPTRRPDSHYLCHPGAIPRHRSAHVQVPARSVRLTTHGRKLYRTHLFRQILPLSLSGTTGTLTMARLTTGSRGGLGRGILVEE